MSDKPDILSALAEPFDPGEVKFKPAAISGNRALALAYVDARVVQDRLDDVMGVEGWQDDYECREDGSVICRLRLRLGGEWITKVDVGGPSEQPDGGDRTKAAFSDALKRAAVKFGVGRYLYRVPNQWVDYDAQKRAFAKPPQMPAAYLPQKKAGVPAAAVPPGPPQQAPEKPHVNDEARKLALVAEIDPRLRAANPPRTWKSGLAYVGVHLSAAFQEPAGAEEAGRLIPGLATIYQLEKLAKELAPKGKHQQTPKGAA